MGTSVLPPPWGHCAAMLSSHNRAAFKAAWCEGQMLGLLPIPGPGRQRELWSSASLPRAPFRCSDIPEGRGEVGAAASLLRHPVWSRMHEVLPTALFSHYSSPQKLGCSDPFPASPLELSSSHVWAAAIPLFLLLAYTNCLDWVNISGNRSNFVSV